MYSLIKLLVYLNPLKLFLRNGEKRKLRILGAAFAAVAVALPNIMPDWAIALVERATGTAVPVAGRQEPIYPPGSTPQGAFAPASPRQQYPKRDNAPGRGELFAAYADLRLRPDQVRRYPDSPAPMTAPPPNVRWLRIDRVVDGDTVTISGQNVRLIGIDSPESKENDHLFRELRRIGAANNRARDMAWLGQESARFLKQIEGRSCWLEYDAEQRDQYGRILAYIHLDNGVIVNEVILRQGYAKVYLGGKFRYVKRYIQLQNEAMNQGIGLWGAK